MKTHGPLTLTTAEEVVISWCEFIPPPCMDVDGALVIDWSVGYRLKRGTSITFRLYRGGAAGRTLLGVLMTQRPPRAHSGIVRLRVLDSQPTDNYTLTAEKRGRWSVRCEPQQPRWRVVAK
jgi:hypothetical protein